MLRILSVGNIETFLQVGLNPGTRAVVRRRAAGSGVPRDGLLTLSNPSKLIHKVVPVEQK